MGNHGKAHSQEFEEWCVRWGSAEISRLWFSWTARRNPAEFRPWLRCVTSFEANSSKKVSLKKFQGGWASEIEPSVTIPFLSYWAIISLCKFPEFPKSAPWSWCYRAFPAHYPVGLGVCSNRHLGFILVGWGGNDNPSDSHERYGASFLRLGFPLLVETWLVPGWLIWDSHVPVLLCLWSVWSNLLMEYFGEEVGKDVSWYFSWVSSPYPHFPQRLSGKIILHFVAKANDLRGLLQP